MGTRKAVLPLLASLAAAAALAAAADRSAVSTSTSAAASAVPHTTAQERRDIRYFSDLGPDRIDVSAYPAEQRQNYAVYARACSRCHGLARSVNAPFASRGYWELYMTSMRMRGRLKGRPFSREEMKSVLDFLDYDSRVRKVDRAAEFEKATLELKRRFNEYVDRRMNELQNEPQPQLLP